MNHENSAGSAWDRRLDHIAEQLKAKEFQIHTDLIGAVFFLVVAFILYLLMPSQVTVSETDVVNGKVFPTMLLWLMMLCSAILIIQGLIKRSRKEPLDTCTINLLIEVKAVVILLILCGTYLISRMTDLFVTGAVFCAISFLLFFRCKKKLYYVITVGMAVLIWIAFRFGLGVRF